MSRLDPWANNVQRLSDNALKFGAPINDEALGGTVDGANRVFTTKNIPRPNSLKVYRLIPPATEYARVPTSDYATSLDTATTPATFKITFIVGRTPAVGTLLMADYRA